MATAKWDWADHTMVGSVYLIHFHLPGDPETVATLNTWGGAGARHYMGFATDLERRMVEHRRATPKHGAKILKHVINAGLDWSVVRVWTPANIEFENRMKRNARLTMLCPICSGIKAYALPRRGPML
jgi:predicted GIY-YIG superfamily endonuclease